jgi:glutamyl-tRNA synthetase
MVLGTILLMSSDVGRFAPSPTGDLHLGNLRTALAAWLSARSAGLGFVVRMEDLDRVTSSARHEAAQLESLRSLGIDWDGIVIRQSDRFGRYDAAIDDLSRRGLTYECYCTRREIREAATAPNGLDGAPEGAYPGTCRTLTDALRRAHVEAGRRPAIRLRSDAQRVELVDEVCGAVSGVVDDVVLRRNDGVPAYNLAVVIDDAAQGVAEVVRGDDLLASTPRQVLLQRLLGLPTPRYRHIPLVLGPDGMRLAKRHGAVTLTDLDAAGIDAATVRSMLAASLGIPADERVPSPHELIARFDVRRIPAEPWILPAHLQRSVP